MKYSCYGCAYEPYASKDEHRCKTCQDCTPLGTVCMTKWASPVTMEPPEPTLPKIGDYVCCTDGHHGVVTKTAHTYYGPMVFITEDNGKPYYFPAYKLTGGK